MVAAAQPRIHRPCPIVVRTTTGTYRGEYLGYDAGRTTTYLVLLEDADCEPRRIPWDTIRGIGRWRWGGKRHTGGAV